MFIQGRKKIDGTDLDEEIQDLEEMLEELQMEKEGGRQSFRQLQRCRGRNFDRQASTLRRRLEKMPVGEEVAIKEIREITLPVLHRQEKALPDDEICRVVAETDDQDENAQMSDVIVTDKKNVNFTKTVIFFFISLFVDLICNFENLKVEVLKRKMEGLSKGKLERMVEQGFMPRWRQEQVWFGITFSSPFYSEILP